ncbi:MAG: hypothetical protein U0Q16_15145 [Bryobacteraceae bacterium]
MRVAAFLLCGAACAWSEQVSLTRVSIDQPYRPLDLKQRLNAYWRGSFSLGAGFQAFAPAWIDHARMHHPEWGGGMRGYGARIGDRYGRFLVSRTIEHATAAALGYEPRYIPCACTATLPRIGHAMKATFITYNRNGKWVPNLPRFAGMVSAPLVAPAWQPHDHHLARTTGIRIGVRFGLNMVTNAGKEFQPELREWIPFLRRN